MRLVNIGYGNVIAAPRIVAVVSPDSAPMKRLKEDARDAGKLIDATQGRRTRSILVTDTDHVILSALSSETIAERVEAIHGPGAGAAGPAGQDGRGGDR
jgi:regulator of extracellular matrix RemA (YlzA/DUF370 family)